MMEQGRILRSPRLDLPPFCVGYGHVIDYPNYNIILKLLKYCFLHTVVPSLLLALSSQLYPIRQAAMKCMYALQSRGIEDASPLWHLVNAVTRSGTAIIDDAEYLHKVCNLHFTSTFM